MQISLYKSVYGVHPLTPMAFCIGIVCLYSCHRRGELTIAALFVTVMLPDNNRFKSITMAAPSGTVNRRIKIYYSGIMALRSARIDINTS